MDRENRKDATEIELQERLSETLSRPIATRGRRKSAPPARELSDPRLVHRAMAATVQDHGTPEAQALYEYWDTFVNPVLFDGALPLQLIQFGALLSNKKDGTYTPRDAQGVVSTITIAHRLIDDLDRAKTTLIHEAIHMALYERDQQPADSEHSYRGHGPLFAKECNRVSAIIDQRFADGTRVTWTEKGRRGGLDCAYFPVFDPAGNQVEIPSDDDEEAQDADQTPGNVPPPTTEIGEGLPIGSALPHRELVKAQAKSLPDNEKADVVEFISAQLPTADLDAVIRRLLSLRAQRDGTHAE